MDNKNIKQAKRDIADAASEAMRTIAQAAEAAAKVVATATAEAVKVRDAKDLQDHDLLIALNAKMEDLKSSIKELKEGTTKRLDDIDTGKLNLVDSYPVLYKAGVETKLTDHEERLRDTEKNLTRVLTWGSAAFVLLGVVQFLISKFL